MRKIIIILTFLVSNNLLAQENLRQTNPFGVNLNIGGPSLLLSGSCDYFITSSLNIEAGLGMIGLFGGIKYHFNRNKYDKNRSSYMGLYTVHVPELKGLWGGINSASGLYIPLGTHYIGKKGFTYGVEVAGIIFNDFGGKINVWGAIKLGYHFKSCK